MHHFVTSLLLIVHAAFAAPQDFAFLGNIDFPHPFCESPTYLDVGQEYFVTIANELPGKAEYNDLIRLFHREDWEKFDPALSTFQRVFETSPLREASTFLEVEAMFERLENFDTPEAKAVEKKLRETLLLYPRSTLAPILTATAASYWLKQGLYQKSLALYEFARKEYPFHPLNCLFQLGVGENSFLLHDMDSATRTFTQIMNKCENQRAKVGAELRLIDIKLRADLKAGAEQLERLYKSESNVMHRFYVSSLYNLGELKYRNKQYPSAKFFFTEFNQSKKKNNSCVPHVLKRMADISFHSKEPMDKVVGLYLAAHEQAPFVDIGRFAYVHGLMLEFKKLPAPELERRIKIIDEESEKISDSELRSTVYLEKGLAMLDAGEKSALGYLVRMNEKKSLNLQKGDLANFVIDKLFQILQEQADGAIDKRLKNESRKDKHVFEPIEEAYTVWIKGTNFEKRAHMLYAKLILRRFDESLADNNLVGAIDKLERWKKSPLWIKSDPPVEAKLHVGSSLTRFVRDANTAANYAFATKLIEKNEVVRPFLEPEFDTLFLAAYQILKDEKKVAQYLETKKGGRTIASLSPRLAGDVQNTLFRKQSQGLAYLKRYKEAEEVLLKIKDKSQTLAITQERIIILREAKNYQKAMKLGMAIAPKIPKKDRLPLLQQLKDVVNEGKLWRSGMELLVVSRLAGVEGKDISSFEYTAGRAQAELGQCEQAVENLRDALLLDPKSKEVPEAKFRLAKCLLKLKKSEQARKSWQEVVELKDSFWSPLAKNELQILETP